MSDDKDTIEKLQAELALRDEEIKAKAATYEETLSREQQKNKEREAKEAAKRNELSQKLLDLTDENAHLKSQLGTLHEKEDELELTKKNLEERKKEIAKLRITHNDEKLNMQEQLEDRRRVTDRQQQEISDLRCQISILEHKLHHATAKQTQHEGQIEEMSKLQLQVQTLQERMAANDRAQSTDVARHQRDRRTLEEKVAKLTEELNKERQPPTKTQVVERYETLLSRKTDLLKRAFQLAARPGGPLPPLSGEDDDQSEAFLEKMKNHISLVEGNAVAAASGSPGSKRKANDAAAEYRKLIDVLERLPLETRKTLLKRFEDCAEANIAASRRFGDTSGFPSVQEDPAVLVNHIANLTSQRDALQGQVDELSRRDSGNGSPRRGNSPPQIVWAQRSPSPRKNPQPFK